MGRCSLLRAKWPLGTFSAKVVVSLNVLGCLWEELGVTGVTCLVERSRTGGRVGEGGDAQKGSRRKLSLGRRQRRRKDSLE